MRTSMCRALSIPEVLSAVLEQVPVEDLPSVRLVSRAFVAACPDSRLFSSRTHLVTPSSIERLARFLDDTPCARHLRNITFCVRQPGHMRCTPDCPHETTALTRRDWWDTQQQILYPQGLLETVVDKLLATTLAGNRTIELSIAQDFHPHAFGTVAWQHDLHAFDTSMAPHPLDDSSFCDRLISIVLSAFTRSPASVHCLRLGTGFTGGNEPKIPNRLGIAGDSFKNFVWTSELSALHHVSISLAETGEWDIADIQGFRKFGTAAPNIHTLELCTNFRAYPQPIRPWYWLKDVFSSHRLAHVCLDNVEGPVGFFDGLLQSHKTTLQELDMPSVVTYDTQCWQPLLTAFLEYPVLRRLKGSLWRRGDDIDDDWEQLIVGGRKRLSIKAQCHDDFRRELGAALSKPVKYLTSV